VIWRHLDALPTYRLPKREIAVETDMMASFPEPTTALMSAVVEYGIKRMMTMMMMASVEG
jgi:hypothetical protein